LGPISFNGGVPTLLVGAGCFATVRLALQLFVVRLPARLSGEVQSQLRGQLYSAFLAASWEEKSKEREGQLQELLGQQTSQAGLAVLQIAIGLAAAMMLLALVGSAFVLSIGMAAGVMAAAGLLFLGLRPLTRRVRGRSAATSAASLAMAASVAESVRMAEEVQVFGTGAAEWTRITSRIEDVRKNFVRTRALSATVPVLYQSVIILLLVLGLSMMYGLGTGRIAALGAVVLLLIRAAAYGQQLQSAYQALGESLPYLDRVWTAIERYSATQRRLGHILVTSLENLELVNVSFAYRPEKLALEDVSFSVTPGEAIGIVGPSGAGKSTLLQVILRLRDPSSGIYLVNGVPGAEIADEVWQRLIAFLPQDPQLITGSAAENIRFSRDWVDDGAVERAARLAHIHDDIMSWPAGYDTLIGQRADAVSGGQRQRLCLARALAGSPELLVLDEPTSSLDLQSERLIQESLTEIRGGITLLLVAHRLTTTLNLCDRVMVVRDGKLEAFAPASLLYTSNDFYKQAVDLAVSGGRP
jgi:ATP-binding cassette subfamily B protein